MIVSIHPTIHISQLSSLIKLQTSAQLSMRRDSYIKTRYTYFCIYHVYYDLKYRRGFIYRRDNIIMISIHSSHIPSTFLLPSVLQFQLVRTWSKICNEVEIWNIFAFKYHLLPMTALLSEVTVEKALVVAGVVGLDSDANVLFVVTVWVVVVSALVVALDPSDVLVVDSFNWDAFVVDVVSVVVVWAKIIIYKH